MTVALRLRAKLPDGDLNGLAHLGDEVLDDPGFRVLIALVGPTTVTENLETGDEVVALGIEQAELVNSREAREVLRRLYAARTGKEELPLELGTPPSADPVDAMFAALGASVTADEADK